MAYAVRRPVENVYLVRERDRRRSRELFGLALAAVPPVVVLFVAIWANVKTVELGYQLARLRQAAGGARRDEAQARDGPRPGGGALAGRGRLPADARPRAPDARPGRAREGRGARAPAPPPCAAARRAPGGALSAPRRPDPSRRAYVLLGLVGLWILVLFVRLVDLQVVRQRRVRAPREEAAGAHRRARAAPRDDRGRGRQAPRGERAGGFRLRDPVGRRRPGRRGRAPRAAPEGAREGPRRGSSRSRQGLRLARAAGPERRRGPRPRALRREAAPGDLARARVDAALPRGAARGGRPRLRRDGQPGARRASSTATTREVRGQPATRDAPARTRRSARTPCARARAARRPREGIEGASLRLTLRAAIQHAAERELASASRRRSTRRAPPRSSSTRRRAPILALASWPPFDPNRFGEADADARKCRPLADAYEPGSTFKIVAARRRARRRHDRPRRPDRLRRRDAHDRLARRSTSTAARRWSALTIGDILAHSSNIGIAHVALGLGRGPFYKAMRELRLRREDGRRARGRDGRPPRRTPRSGARSRSRRWRSARRSASRSSRWRARTPRSRTAASCRRSTSSRA